MTKKSKKCDYAIVKIDQNGNPTKLCFSITQDMVDYCDKFRRLQLSDEKKEKFKALLDHLLLSLNDHHIP